MTLHQLYRAGLLRIVDCAECNRRLTGASHREQYEQEQARGVLTESVPQLIAGRWKGRPYCRRDFNALHDYEPGVPGVRRRLSGRELRGSEASGEE